MDPTASRLSAAVFGLRVAVQLDRTLDSWLGIALGLIIENNGLDKTKSLEKPSDFADWRLVRTNLMKAVRFSEFGTPSVLRIEEVAIPEPGEGEALVRVKAAGINPSDIGDVAGRFKKTTLPRTPGRDFAGVVAKGAQHEGEEVWGSAPNLGIVRDGSHAEYVVVPVETLSLKPKSLSMAQAGAIGIPYITAWASVVNAAQIQPG